MSVPLSLGGRYDPDHANHVSPQLIAQADLRAKVRHFCDAHPIDSTVPRKTCADLVQWLAREGKTDLLTITAQFDSKVHYPDRPMIQLSGFVADEPTVWLLGWRAGEQTPIHDHDHSEVGIHIFEGAVTEHIYVPDKAEPTEPGEESNFRKVERELLENSTVRITSPYVHLFEKTCAGHECVHATTIHAYWPRLLSMRFFEVMGDKLVYHGIWQDNG